ncbi:MAG: MBL fold metallo-hydrolase [Erysipelotrichaceae bacterium]|nr:MBL fold metallo-hydrolase [Erysipelotrichaceae bacterium]
MKKIAILRIDMDVNGFISTLHPVIVSDDQEMVLFDCGHSGALNQLTDKAFLAGFDLSKLTKVIITHHDHDHMGGLADLKREYPWIRIYASAIEADYISGKTKSIRLQQAEEQLELLSEDQKEHALNRIRMLRLIEPVEVDEILQDGDVLEICGGIEVVASPGHMPGHISLYLRDFKTMIAGDALVVADGKLYRANPRFTLDKDEAYTSARRFINYAIDTLICYHGGAITENIKESLENL